MITGMRVCKLCLPVKLTGMRVCDLCQQKRQLPPAGLCLTATRHERQELVTALPVPPSWCTPVPVTRHSECCVSVDEYVTLE